MKTIPVSFLLAGILAPSVALAQPQEPAGQPRGEGKREGRPPGPPFAELWKQVDRNADGFLSKAEFDAMPRTAKLPEDKRTAIFARLDKDGDGKLSREELGRFVNKPHDGEGPPRKRLWELDLDKSGGVDFEEFKKGELFKKLPAEKQAEVFKRLDTDGDGVITPKDRPEPLKRPGEKRDKEKDGDRDKETEDGHINRKLDLDGDGALTFQEFRQGNAVKNLTEDEQEDRFELLDRNGDHKLSIEDFPKPPAEPAPAAPPEMKPAG